MTMTKTEPTIVIFRKWKESSGEGIIALFPELPADNDGFYCDSYEHVGQHGAADYSGLMRTTVPAKPSECLNLATELRRIGYKLVVRHRVSPAMNEKRRKLARQT